MSVRLLSGDPPRSAVLTLLLIAIVAALAAAPIDEVAKAGLTDLARRVADRSA